MRTVKMMLCFLFLIGSALQLQGCLEIHSVSQVNSDGSIHRTISFTGDSSSVYGRNFPVTIDSTWQQSIETKEEKDKKQYTLTAKRLFLSVDEMNQVLTGVFGKTLQYRFELDEDFQWFFTVYRYREINLPFVQYTMLPVADFVNPALIDSFRSHQIDKVPYQSAGDSLALVAAASKAEEWISRNRFEPLYQAFLQGVKRRNDPALPGSFIEKQKEVLFKGTVDRTENYQAKKIDTLKHLFAAVLKSKQALQVWEGQEKEFEEIRRHFEFEERTGENSYTTSVIMPGLITGTNAQSIEGNKATWKDFLEYSKYFEYTMWIESRQVNWWAVIVTGIIVIVLLFSVSVSMLARRKQRSGVFQ